MATLTPLPRGSDEWHLLVDVQVVDDGGVPRVCLTRYSMDAYERDPRRPPLDWAHSVVLAGDLWDAPAQVDANLSLEQRQRQSRARSFRDFGHSACVAVYHSPTATPFLAIDVSMCRDAGLAHAAVAADGVSCLVGIRGRPLFAGMLVTMSPADAADPGPVEMYASALYGWLVWRAQPEREPGKRLRSWRDLPEWLDLVEAGTMTRVRLAGGPGPWGQWPVAYNKPPREQLAREYWFGTSDFS